MNILYRDFITTQSSSLQYQKSILSLFFSISTFVILVLLFFLFKKEKGGKSFSFLVLALISLLYTINETNNLKKIKYRFNHYETYNQYYVSKNSKIDLNKFKIKSKNDDYIIIEDKHHHYVVEP